VILVVLPLQEKHFRLSKSVMQKSTSPIQAQERDRGFFKLRKSIPIKITQAGKTFTSPKQALNT
jgi:hypothetical protein